MTNTLKIPQGMKTHDGTPKVPDDYDGGPVMFRDGVLCSGSRLRDPHFWDWEQDVDLNDDIIAYTPRAVSEADGDAVVQGDVILSGEQYRELVARTTTDAARIAQLEADNARLREELANRATLAINPVWFATDYNYRQCVNSVYQALAATEARDGQ